MAYRRYDIQLAFLEPISPALQGQLNALEQLVRVIKQNAVKINVGLGNEEDTTRAKRHRCLHDENLLCEPEVDI